MILKWISENLLLLNIDERNAVLWPYFMECCILRLVLLILLLPPQPSARKCLIIICCFIKSVNTNPFAKQPFRNEWINCIEDCNPGEHTDSLQVKLFQPSSIPLVFFLVPQYYLLFQKSPLFTTTAADLVSDSPIFTALNTSYWFAASFRKLSPTSVFGTHILGSPSKYQVFIQDAHNICWNSPTWY